ncbi:uncharacterized protein G2W53_029310 [Senna tora]|uniref:Uncharacterized protein n=1 Tax=Senna tora TaxID=362788 RepID=A0A834T715_9FABA|nr:uncharacterized protein G2W53_029310 [Senna tora]
MSPKKTIENKKTSHERDQPKMIKKEEDDDRLRLPTKEDDNKQEDIISKDLNVRSSAHINFGDSSEKSPELFCIADYEIPGDIPNFQTLVLEFSRNMRIWRRFSQGSVVEEWNLLINEETKPRCDGEAVPRSILRGREECA